MTTETTPLRIVGLHAENVKRIKVVTIRPDGSLITVGGNNGNGKTSLMDAIEWALGGNAGLPAMPIRHGQSKATIELDLGELVIRKTITAKGPSLSVQDKDGVPLRAPQAILDSLYNRLTFDPLAFTRMKAAEQLGVLRRLTGVDTADLDQERAKLYAQRTAVNRSVEVLQAQLDGMPRYEDAPKDLEAPLNRVCPKLLDFDDLAEKRQTVFAKTKGNADARAHLELLRGAEREAERRTLHWTNEVERLRGELQDAEAMLSNAIESHKNARKATADSYEQVSALIDPSLADIDAEEKRRREANEKTLAEFDAESDRLEAARIEANAKVEANRRYLKAKAAVGKETIQADALTQRIDDIDADKRRRLAEAKFPVPDLDFGSDGVLYKGVPFEQASSAEQLRVSVAMGLAMNPRLRVMLVRDGSLLDANSVRLLAELAEQNDAQVWMEVVGKDRRCSVVIEDGSIEAPRPAEVGATA